MVTDMATVMTRADTEATEKAIQATLAMGTKDQVDLIRRVPQLRRSNTLGIWVQLCRSSVKTTNMSPGR